MPEFYGPRGSEHVIPPVQNALPIHASRHVWLQSGIVVQVDRTRAIQPATADIPQPRREAMAYQIEEGKDDFGGPRRIGRMLPDRQVRFIVTNFVEYVGRIADRDDHGLGTILRELVRGPTRERE